ncbi:MAG: hypothetical protein RBU23_12935 [Candidatus Auribacterota bacterium]|nr:hypothetical protein [Candidatus Auribacterota bacterium]
MVTNEVVRDSIVTLPPDSAMIKAWFECDSLNHVIMTELETQAGKLVQPSTNFNGRLMVTTAKIDSQAIYLKWKERHQTASITNTVIKEVPVEKVVYKKPAWLLVLAASGAGGIIIFVVSIILKFK